ncbi:MAG: hypothetical protein JW754_03175, partial [Candidatus Aenigmarchaeota archaeon]|nr:hypothetical protein [Candidatus Aenigmarchaeota archaeon]
MNRHLHPRIGRKTKSQFGGTGQSQLILSVVFLALISSVVAAQTMISINETINMSLTGGIIADDHSSVISATKTIDVFAGTVMETFADERVVRGEEIGISAILLMDNGTGIEGTVDFYLDRRFVGSMTTGPSGGTSGMFISTGEMEPGRHSVISEFTGHGYLKPSSSEVWVNVEENQEETLAIQAEQSIKGNHVTIKGNVTPEGHEYNVSIILLDAYNNFAYRKSIITSRDFDFDFDLEPGGYETMIVTENGDKKTKFLLDTKIKRPAYARSMMSSGLAGDAVSYPVTYDPQTDTIQVTGNGNYCTPENPCDIGFLYNEDIINGWGRIEKYNNYFVIRSKIIIGDGVHETWFSSENEHFDIRKPWILENGTNFQMGKYMEGKPAVGGTIFSKVPSAEEGPGNSAFIARPGSNVTILATDFKVMEERASNNFVVEEGSAFHVNRINIERETKLNNTAFIHPDESFSEDMSFSHNIIANGSRPSHVEHIMVINEHESPKEGENWTIEFVTVGTGDLVIEYQNGTAEDIEFIGLYCGDQKMEPSFSGDYVIYDLWECDGKAKLIHEIITEGPHNISFSFAGETVYARNTDYSGVCIFHVNGAEYYVLSDGSTCCTASNPCEIQDVCDSFSGRCSTSKGANVDLFHPEDTNLWTFLYDFYIGRTSTVTVGSYNTHFYSENEIINLGDPSNMDVAAQVDERGHWRFGQLSSAGPQAGCTIQAYVDTSNDICDQANLCFRDRLNTSCMDDGVPGGSGYFYASNYISFKTNTNRANLDAGSPGGSTEPSGSIYANGTSCDSSGEKGGKSTAHIDINRFTLQGHTALSNKADGTGPIFYVPANTTLYDHQAVNNRYAMEMSGEPDTVLEKIQLQDSTAGIRICYANGKVREFYGVDNYYDVRMGQYHYLIAIDSQIDESAIDDNSCGSGSNDDSYILKQTSFNVGLKNVQDSGIEDATVAARNVRGDLSFNVSTYANGTIEEQILDFRKIMVLADGEANQPKGNFTPHEFYFRKYDYKYSKTSMSMEDPISTSLVLFDNLCTVYSESSAASQTGITYEPPDHRDFSDTSEDQTVGTDDSITLTGTPVAQSEHFQILNTEGIHATRLVPVGQVPKANYDVNYENGTIMFEDGYETTEVRPVYFYGGNITLTQNRTLNNIYDYMQAIQTNYSLGEEYLTDVFTVSDDCGTYTSYVDLILDGSMINQTTEKKVNIEDGYGFSATSDNGSLINVISDNWQFVWKSDNGTLFRRYTLDVSVQNSVGTPLENATVTLTDTNSDTVFEINTSSDGTMPQQAISYAEYWDGGNETLSPFTITVTKSPYSQYSAPLALDGKTSLVVTLTTPCNPDLGYSFTVEAGDGVNTNRSAGASNLTMVVKVAIAGNSLTTEDQESGEYQMVAQEGASDQSINYTTSGSDSFSVPEGVTDILVKMWGAGGGSGGSDNDQSGPTSGDGGGGGFVTGNVSVTPGETLNLTVGAGGGGGSGAQESGEGGGGGGYSIMNRSNNIVMIAAGGGGGGGTSHDAAYDHGGEGGAGGGTTGETGGRGDANGGADQGGYGGEGGSQSSGGSGGSGDTGGDGESGSSLQGGDGASLTDCSTGTGGAGNSGSPGGGEGGSFTSGTNNCGQGGGGGGGYYGGGGGEAGPDEGGGGGGGGSGFFNNTLVTGGSTSGGSGQNPANTSDPYYADNAGQGGASVSGTGSGADGNDGNSGRIVIIYDTTSSNESELSWTTYSSLTSQEMDDITRVNVSVNVSYYNGTGSTANGNKAPDIQLAVYNGTGWVNVGNFSIDSTGMYWLTTTDQSVMDAWNGTSSSNRSIRVRGVDFDYNDSGNYDEINWTDIWVEIEYGGGTLGAGTNVDLYITKVGSGAGATWDSGRTLVTNATGHINFSFFPSCDNASTPLIDEEYEVGKHDWYAEITTSQDPELCTDQQSDTFNFNVTGTLLNNIDLPDGTENYTAADTILIQGAVENYCGEPITLNTTTQIEYNLSTSSGSYITNCSAIDKVGANVYKCNWNPDQETQAGWYNLTMWSSYTGYYENTTEIGNLFYLTTSPSMTQANVTPRQDSWDITHNFSVRVADNLGDLVNVTLQEQILGQSWYDVSSQTCENCSDNAEGYVSLNFTNQYSCSGYAGNWMKFRFMANDSEGNLVYTDSFSQYWDQDDTFELQKANVNVTYVSGNNSQAQPTIKATLAVRVYDLDNSTKNFSTGEYPLVRFYVENSSGKMEFVNQSYTNSTGYANVSFFPNTHFNQGNKTWYAIVSSADSCYKYNISENLTVEIIANWPPIYRNMTVNSKTTDSKGWGGGWNFSVEVKDYGTETGDLNITLQTNTGSGWTNKGTENCTSCSAWTSINFTDVLLACSDINSSARFRFNVTDDSGNVNVTSSRTFSVKKDGVVFEHVSGDDTTANRSGSQTDTLKLRLRDNDNNTYLLSGINATLWVSYSGPPGYVYDDGHYLQTDGSGNISFDFDPGCDDEYDNEYVTGKQRWYAQVNSSETCYYANVSSVYDLTVNATF